MYSVYSTLQAVSCGGSVLVWINVVNLRHAWLVVGWVNVHEFESQSHHHGIQGCSLGLERLGLEAVSRRLLERLGLVSVLEVEHLGLKSMEKSKVLVLSLIHI